MKSLAHMGEKSLTVQVVDFVENKGRYVIIGSSGRGGRITARLYIYC